MKGWTREEMNAHLAKFGRGVNTTTFLDAVGVAGCKATIETVAETGRPDERVNVPNHTEQEAFDLLGLLHRGCIYEARTFEVVGHSYTPDWTGPDTAVEVKAERIHSRDSRILFDAARLAHPELTWIWARKRTTGRKGPRWDVEVYQRKVVRG